MTDLLERLRAANPIPSCDMPRLDDVWHKLEQEAANDRPATTRTRARGAWLSHAALLVTVTVAVAVGALMLVLLGHNQNHNGEVAAHRTVTPARHAPPKSTSIDSALAHGVHPPAPDQTTRLPILGVAGTRTLKDFRGEVVVLNFFASWCRPCKAESAMLKRTQRRIAGHGATVLGVTYLNAAADALAFVRSEHVNYPVLRDPTGRFVRSFGTNGLPETFVIDRHGRIVAARRYQLEHRWLARVLHLARTSGRSPDRKRH